MVAPCFNNCAKVSASCICIFRTGGIVPRERGSPPVGMTQSSCEWLGSAGMSPATAITSCRPADPSSQRPSFACRCRRAWRRAARLVPAQPEHGGGLRLPNDTSPSEAASAVMPTAIARHRPADRRSATTDSRRRGPGGRFDLAPKLARGVKPLRPRRTATRAVRATGRLAGKRSVARFSISRASSRSPRKHIQSKLGGEHACVQCFRDRRSSFQTSAQAHSPRLIKLFIVGNGTPSRRASSG